MTIILIYILTMLRVLDWGIPGTDHPFTYHMDEWHQMNAVRAVYKYATPNIEGSANGTMFHFIQAGLYLFPFALLGIINPWAAKSGVDSLLIQGKIFEILRLNTLIWGTLSIGILIKICRDYLKVNPIMSVFVFTITPIWLSLSNYFKYDITLVFWILMSLYLTLKFGKNPSLKNYILAGVSSALAAATKVSGIPLLVIFGLAYFWYTPRPKWKLATFLGGICAYVIAFVLLGIPDALLRKGSYYEYFYSNLVFTPKISFNINWGSPWWVYIYFKELPVLFGHFVYIAAVLSGIYLVFKKSFDKSEGLILASLIIFFLSLLPLKASATGNRALVLLPYFSLITGLTVADLLHRISNSTRRICLGLMLFGVVVQIIEASSWIAIKLASDPRKTSSIWLQRNISQGSVIGVENIPIYQMLPDIVVSEFYKSNNNRFEYLVVEDKSATLPETVIVSNAEMASKLFKKSQKKDLVRRLGEEGYRETRFELDRGWYKYFGTEENFYLSGLVASPVSISVFRRVDSATNKL